MTDAAERSCGASCGTGALLAPRAWWMTGAFPPLGPARRSAVPPEGSRRWRARAGRTAGRRCGPGPRSARDGPPRGAPPRRSRRRAAPAAARAVVAVTTGRQTSLLGDDELGGLRPPPHAPLPGSAAGGALPSSGLEEAGRPARKVYRGHHDLASGPGTPAHHWPSWRETRLAACDATLTLVPHSGVHPSTVVEDARCRRVACRREWARWFAERPDDRDPDALPWVD
jgi:hypothetical protein